MIIHTRKHKNDLVKRTYKYYAYKPLPIILLKHYHYIWSYYLHISVWNSIVVSAKYNNLAPQISPNRKKSVAWNILMRTEYNNNKTILAWPPAKCQFTSTKTNIRLVRMIVCVGGLCRRYIFIYYIWMRQETRKHAKKAHSPTNTFAMTWHMVWYIFVFWCVGNFMLEIYRAQACQIWYLHCFSSFELRSHLLWWLDCCT